MPHYDLIVRGGYAVGDTGVTPSDIAVSDGRIAAVAPEIAGTSHAEIDARGLHVFPGVVDAHVHFNEPGRAAWEGWATGTRALAAGGGTACCEMPLNARPPTIDAASFDAKRAAAETAAVTDFALWGGIVPGNLDHLDELAERGVVGFKAFMSASGVADFPAADDLTLLKGMERAARLGRIVAVHAENDAITRGLAAAARANRRSGMRDYLASRPAIAELEAIARAILFAEETGCALHVVHVSTGRGIALIAAARGRGVAVTCETCPHYLAFDEDDAVRLGAIGKCAPPLRPATDRNALWDALRAGILPMVASDHSPAPPQMKTGSDSFDIWGGISGCQTLLPLLLSDGYHARDLPLPTIAAATAGFPARRFGLAGKGRLAPGADADLALVQLDAAYTLTSDDLLYRHRHSPFVGYPFRGRVVRTLLRGTTTYHDGRIVASPLGRFLRPESISSPNA